MAERHRERNHKHHTPSRHEDRIEHEERRHRDRELHRRRYRSRYESRSRSRGKRHYYRRDSRRRDSRRRDSRRRDSRRCSRRERGLKRYTYSRSRSNYQRRERRRSPLSSSYDHQYEESSSKRSSSKDDTVGWDRFKKRDVLNGRYEICNIAGEGTFGRVYECKDKVEDIVVAVKVVRSVERYTESAQIEAEILSKVKERDPHGHSNCVKIIDTFTEGRHYCIVFEKLGWSLYDCLKNNQFYPFTLSAIRCFTRQLIQALAYCHSIGLTHTDLKLENLLLLHDASVTVVDKLLHVNIPEIRVIDFGGATFEDDHHTTIINTRQYRAPEVILECGWDEKSDLWSVGCIVMECYTGNLLFPTHDNHEHLAIMEKVIGEIPKRLVIKASHSAKKMFDSQSHLHWPTSSTSRESRTHVEKQKCLEEIIAPDHQDLLDFVRTILRYCPEDRPSASTLLSHPFLAT